MLQAVLIAFSISGCGSTAMYVPAYQTIESRGPAPSKAGAVMAVDRYLRQTLKDYDSMKNFSIVFGPEAMTATTVNNSFDEAWLMCAEYNAKNSYGAYTGLARHAVPMRLAANSEVEIVSQAGWRMITPNC